MNRYKLVTAEDGIVWVSIQPLKQDVLDALNKLEQQDVSKLSKVEGEIMDFNITGMKAIATFLGALLQEANHEIIDRQTPHKSH
jgi:hypothetical protein